MAKRPTAKYDFKAFGQAIKAARTERKESRKKVSDEMYISPRYLANIENKGQQPSLQIFYELVTRYDISVDQFFFPDKSAEMSGFDRYLAEQFAAQRIDPCQYQTTWKIVTGQIL